MNRSRARAASFFAPVLSLLALILSASTARAQNPVQWSGSVSQSVARATEQSLPLLFWVTGGRDLGDDDDLSDAQSDCFRDPTVVAIIRKHFIPVRVSRTSNVLQEAERLGLPTAHGLYCAVLTSDGRLLDQMGPAEVADPIAFAAHLRSAFGSFCGDLYHGQIQPLLENLETPKAQARRAVQAVYRLDIKSADRAVIGLLARPDLTPSETSRLYDLLASLGTQATVGALLDRSSEPTAVAALNRASPDALEWLAGELPHEEGDLQPRQLAAYEAAARISRTSSKGKAWWPKADAKARREELDRLRARAQAVLEYWRETEGGTR
jgi:hypothetical protein